MNFVRPRFSWKWQATAGRASMLSRHFWPLHQQVGNRAACITQSCPASYSRRAGVCGHASSHYFICSLPTKPPQGTSSGRASFSTEASTVTGNPTIHDIFEDKTNTWQYVVADPSTLTAVIIDPVLDYDPATQVITTETADSLLSLVEERGYKVDRLLETHAHADHLTAASYLQNRLAQEQGHRPPIGIGKRIRQVQELFGQRYGIPEEEYEGVFEQLFDDDETFNIGKLSATAIHLPGHTPDHLGYKIGGKRPPPPSPQTPTANLTRVG